MLTHFRIIGKWLLALKCLRSAHEIDPENPTLHHQTVRFKQARKFLLLILHRA